MGKKANRVTEAEVAFAALQIAAAQSNGVASFHRLKQEIPNYLKLSADDQQQSTTRPNEEMWEQLIRNIKSHFDVPGNFICDGYLEHVKGVGYRTTTAGKQLLKSKGY